MALGNDAQKDRNFVSTLLAVSSADLITTVTVAADPVTHRLLTEPGSITSLFQKDTFTSTNNQTTFTPSKTVAFDIYFSVNGSTQSPATDYSIVGGSYVLNSGIPSGCAIILCYTTS